MKSFKSPSRLRKVAMSSIVKKKSPEELKELRHAFKNADTDNSGTLERNELI